MDTATTPTTLDSVLAIYGAFGRGDVPALLALLHPEVEWSVTSDAPGAEHVPMLRHGVGRDAAARYFAGVAELEVQAFDVDRILVDGDVAVAEIRLQAAHRGTGRRASMAELHHWTVRDGQVVRYRPYLDPTALIEIYRP